MSTVGIREVGHKFASSTLGKARTYSRELPFPRSLAQAQYQQQASKNIISDTKIFHPPKTNTGGSVPIGFSKALRSTNIPTPNYSTKNESRTRYDDFPRSNREASNIRMSDNKIYKSSIQREITKETLNSSRPDSQEKPKKYTIRSGVSIDRRDRQNTNSNNNRVTPSSGSRNVVVRNSSVNPTIGGKNDKYSNYQNSEEYHIGGNYRQDSANKKSGIVQSKYTEISREEESPTFGGGKVSSNRNIKNTAMLTDKSTGSHSNYHAYPGRREVDSRDVGRISPTFGSQSENTRSLQYKGRQEMSTNQSKYGRYDRDDKSSRGSDRESKPYPYSNTSGLKSNLIQGMDRMKGGNSTYSYGTTNKAKPENLVSDADDRKIDRKVTSHVTYLASPNASTVPKGLVGLRNIGNTCFMNSILQCLFNAPMFSDYFLRNNHKKEKNSKSKGIADAFGSQLEKMRSHSGGPSYNAETPSELKSKIAKVNPMFSGYDQHDAQELLKAVLEGINDDLNRVVTKPPYKELTADPSRKLQDISDEWFNYMLARDNSVVTDLFCGQLLSRTTCMTCGYESLAFDNFWDIALSFTKTSSSKTHLNDMLAQFLKEEVLEDLFSCEKCKTRRKSKKRFVIWRLPKILVVQLKRFEYTRYSRSKINKAITFPVKCFDLNQYTGESSDSSVNDTKYTLFGIVNHGGSLGGGHYTAECMNPYDRKWYDFNDSSVSKTSMRDDESEGSSPYMLFYIKTSCLAN